MKKIELKHSRFAGKTGLTIDGDDVQLKCFGTGEGVREVDWAAFFEELINDKCNLGPGAECEIEFRGGESDFKAMEEARKEFCDKVPGINIKLTPHCGAYLQELKKSNDEVLRIWEEYRFFKERVQISDNFFANLEKTAQNIKEDKFNLMVAGEAKSGKSTFINAFLGVDILPMHINQCTSAIIEITHGEQIKLTAKKAGGSTETREEKEHVREFLKEHAALSDESRNIPVTAINNEILIKSKGNVKDSEIEDLIKGVKSDNIYGLKEEEYGNAIRKYISGNKDKWQDIVTQINITYPLSDEMREITVIDSPGVNAGGRVGAITESFISKADAIIFVKPMGPGNALESASFIKFFESNSVQRSPAALFLVFTGKSLLSDRDFKEKRQQAVEMYKNSVPEEHIAFVDSMQQLFYHRCENMPETEIEEYLKKEDLFGYILWLESSKEKTKFRSALERYAAFDEISKMLNKFAGTAKYNRLLEFLDNINSGYDDIKGDLNDHKAVLDNSDEDPAKLKEEVEKKKKEIDEIVNKLYKVIDEIPASYMEIESGRIKNKADEEFAKFKENLETATDWDSLEKKTLEGQDKYASFQDEIQKEVVAECDNNLIELTDKTGLSFETVKPRLTKEDFSEIKRNKRGKRQKG